MWTKLNRLIVINLIYQDLYQSNFEFSPEMGLFSILELIKIWQVESPQLFQGQEPLSEFETNKIFQEYSIKKSEFLEKINNYLDNLNQTSLISQAILVCFLLEIQNLESDILLNNKKTLINQYLKLTVDIFNQESVGYTQACMNKILDEKLFLEKDSTN